MNIFIFLALLAIIVTTIILIIEKRNSYIGAFDRPAFLFGCFFSVILSIFIVSTNTTTFGDTNVLIKNYIENHVNQSKGSIDDETIESDIKTICKKRLENNLKDVHVSSSMYEKAQTRVIKIKLSIGKYIYCNYNLEYTINNVTKEISSN